MSGLNIFKASDVVTLIGVVASVILPKLFLEGTEIVEIVEPIDEEEIIEEAPESLND